MALIKYDITRPLADLDALTLATALGNIYAIELTAGCSGACNFCCFNSCYPVKGYASFASLKKLADMLSEHKVTIGQAMLYHATDPLDYFDEQDEADYLQVVKLFTERGLIKEIHTTTTCPQDRLIQVARFTLWYMEQLLTGKVTGGLRFSVTAQNEERVTKLLTAVFENFLKTHTRVELNLVAKRVIEDLLPDYLTETGALSWSVDIHRIDATTAIKQGRAYKSDTREPIKDSLTTACYDGVLLTPTKLLGVVAVAPTDAHQTGIEAWEITPSNKGVPLVRWIDKQRVLIDYIDHAKGKNPYNQLVLEFTYRLLQPARIITATGKVVEYRSLNRALYAMALLADNLSVFADTENLNRWELWKPHVAGVRCGYLRLKRLARRLLRASGDRGARASYQALTRRLDGLLGLSWLGRLY